MKALIAALAVAAATGSAFAAEPVGKRTPNGGFEYYSTSPAGQGTIENGCILPWHLRGWPTMGYNPKRVDMGDQTHFIDCKIPKPVVVVEKRTEAVIIQKTETVTTKVEEKRPMQVQRKPVRE
jgi:hypothetical protein